MEGPPEREPGFVAGVTSLFSGFGFVLTTPSVWPFALVPVTIALGLSVVLGGFAIGFVPGWIAGWFNATSALGLAGAWLVKVLATAIALVAAALIGFSLAQPLSGPALNRIATAMEAKLGAPPWPKASFLDDVVKGLQSIAVAYLFGLPILAILFAVNFFFPPAAVVTFPLKLVTVAMLLAWDLCDYPLSLRGLPVGVRIAFMKRHLGAMVGFGAGLALLSLVPCALLLVLPAGVAGAARLIASLERWEASRPGDRA